MTASNVTEVVEEKEIKAEEEEPVEQGMATRLNRLALAALDDNLRQKRAARSSARRIVESVPPVVDAAAKK